MKARVRIMEKKGQGHLCLKNCRLVVARGYVKRGRSIPKEVRCLNSFGQSDGELSAACADSDSKVRASQDS